MFEASLSQYVHDTPYIRRIIIPIETPQVYPTYPTHEMVLSALLTTTRNNLKAKEHINKLTRLLLSYLCELQSSSVIGYDIAEGSDRTVVQYIKKRTGPTNKSWVLELPRQMGKGINASDLPVIDIAEMYPKNL